MAANTGVAGLSPTATGLGYRPALGEADTASSAGTDFTGGVVGFRVGNVIARAGSSLLGRIGLGRTAVESATAHAARLGLEGEQAIGITGPKVGIRIPGSNQLRFQDTIDLKGARLIESKNVSHQGYTRQLRDYSACAEDKGLTFELYVRGASNPLGQTRLSKLFADAVRRGEIVLTIIPGK
ncbi:putative toxin [Sphingomonas fuzhouensis]|uniref:putative toxin n=1 Tax=Sphingomonas fuzhouensis TaxID=3106033 RepID=UPI002B000B30|nr:putative toxin [Sphingomonas sp. SGZ-02]